MSKRMIDHMRLSRGTRSRDLEGHDNINASQSSGSHGSIKLRIDVHSTYCRGD